MTKAKLNPKTTSGLNPRANHRGNYRGKAAEDRSAERRARLLEAGLELFGTQGYTATSVKAVCEKAGLTERYFYESFANREDLFMAVAATCVAGLMHELMRARHKNEANIDDQLHAMLTALFKWFQDDARRARIQLFEPFFISAKLHTLYRQVNSMFANFMSEVTLSWYQNNKNRSAQELNDVIAGFVGAVIEMLREWVLSDFARSLPEAVKNAEVFYKALTLYFEQEQA